LVLDHIVLGALAGLGWGILGYINSYLKYEGKVEFSWKGMAKSVLIGAGLGVYSIAQGLPIAYDTFSLLVSNPNSLGFVAIVDRIVDLIERFIKSKLE
jgi:hypothetical protein